MPRRSPTVLIARSVRPGHEDEFAAWLTRVTDAARRAPGHVDVDVQRPDSVHPNDWIVAYRFIDADSLEQWLSSDERLGLIAEGADLIEGEPRTQVFATESIGPDVRMVTSYLLKESHGHEHKEVHAAIMRELSTFAGFRDREILPAIPGIQRETVVILTFEDEMSLRRWLDSPVRARLLARLDSHIEGTYTTNILGGFAGWFAFDGETQPKRWKQAAVVLLALFPTALLLTYLRIVFWPDVPVVFGVFIGNVAGVAALTWVLMPPLTRWLSGWLRR